MSHPEATPRTDALLVDPKTGRTIIVHGETFEALESLCRQLERELAEARNIIERCHEAVGEAPESDDPSLPDCIKAHISERSARISELEILLSQERAARLAAEEFISKAFDVYPNLDLDIQSLAQGAGHD